MFDIWNNLNFLSKLSSIVSVLAITLVFLGGFLQLSKFTIDHRLHSLREQVQFAKDKQYQNKIAQLEPRKLSIEQKKLLKDKLSLKKGPTIVFVSRLMDGESLDFANMIASIFLEAGWDVKPTIRTSINDFPGFLSLFITGNVDSEALNISKMLNDVNILCRNEPIEAGSIGSIPYENSIYIVVGRKGAQE
jgi:hypothetical protein